MKVEWDEVMEIVNKHARNRDSAVHLLRKALVAKFESEDAAESSESGGVEDDTDTSEEDTGDNGESDADTRSDADTDEDETEAVPA